MDSQAIVLLKGIPLLSQRRLLSLSPRMLTLPSGSLPDFGREQILVSMVEHACPSNLATTPMQLTSPLLGVGDFETLHICVAIPVNDMTGVY